MELFKLKYFGSIWEEKAVHTSRARIEIILKVSCYSNGFYNIIFSVDLLLRNFMNLHQCKVSNAGAFFLCVKKEFQLV